MLHCTAIVLRCFFYFGISITLSNGLDGIYLKYKPRTCILPIKYFLIRPSSCCTMFGWAVLGFGWAVLGLLLYWGKFVLCVFIQIFLCIYTAWHLIEKHRSFWNFWLFIVLCIIKLLIFSLKLYPCEIEIQCSFLNDKTEKLTLWIKCVNIAKIFLLIQDITLLNCTLYSKAAVFEL